MQRGRGLLDLDPVRGAHTGQGAPSAASWAPRGLPGSRCAGYDPLACIERSTPASVEPQVRTWLRSLPQGAVAFEARAGTRMKAQARSKPEEGDGAGRHLHAPTDPARGLILGPAAPALSPPINWSPTLIRDDR